MGLGPNAVSLADARQTAAPLHRLVRNGASPAKVGLYRSAIITAESPIQTIMPLYNNGVPIDLAQPDR